MICILKYLILASTYSRISNQLNKYRIALGLTNSIAEKKGCGVKLTQVIVIEEMSAIEKNTHTQLTVTYMYFHSTDNKYTI